MKDFMIRFVPFIIFAPFFYLSLIADEPHFFSAFIVFISVVSTIEYWKMFEKKGYRIIPFILFPANLAIYYLFYAKLTQFIIPLILIAFVALVVVSLLRDDFENVVNSLALNIFGIIYLGVMPGGIIAMKLLPEGHRFLIMLIFSTWACDSWAYIIGKAFGKHKLNFRVSPHKTLEGYIGGIIFSWLGIVFTSLVWVNLEMQWWWAIIPFLTIIGDLLESILKRAVGVKDSSAFIPGHGGFLDGFDSLIFVTPIFYYIMTLLA